MSPANRSLVVGLLVGMAAMVVGLGVAWATFPDSDEMRSDALAELGVDPRVSQTPIVDEVLDRLTQQGQDGIVDDARRSAAAGVVSAAAAAATGVAVASATRSRRPAEPSMDPDAHTPHGPGPSGAPPPGSF